MKATPPPPEPTAPPAAGPDPVPAPPPGPAAPAAWPGWFGPADVAITVLVLVAGFLGASFAARDSDLWLHLGTGRLVAQGAYPVGGDPFSYTGADRPWANQAWLFDLGLYAAYSADPSGAALVALKAAAFAGAFGLLLLLRRPGQALWPWAVAVALGVLAALPQAGLRPAVASMVCLSLTLLVLFRRPWCAVGWREPAMLAGLFAVWANLDAWFVLGPFAVLLVLVGELLHRRVIGGVEAGCAVPADPLPAAPPPRLLARALGLGTAACFLNPTFLAALAKDPGEALAQLVPVELGWTLPAEVAADPAGLTRMTLSPLNPEFLERADLGYNPNGLAAAVLLVGGAVALAAGFARVRIAHVALWVGFAALAFQQYRLVPFFAVAAVPLAAAYLNALSARVRLGGPREAGTRVLLTLSGVGRIVCVAAALVMAAAAWPGWLQHVPRRDPALAARVEWAVAPDPGLANAAAAVGRWRADGALGADVRGVSPAAEYGNYAAWFAPGEKVFLNSRYAFHRRELPAFVRLRRVLAALVQPPGEKEAEADARGRFEAARAALRDLPGGATYLAVVRTGAGATRAWGRAAAALTLDPDPGWVLWHLDGAATVTGRAGAPGVGRVAFDPVRLAFRADQEPLPPPPARPPGAVTGLLAEYVGRTAPPPRAAEDAEAWLWYAAQRKAAADARLQQARGRTFTGSAALAGVVAGFAVAEVPVPVDGVQVALPLLAARAARRAVAAAPARPEGYAALADACLAGFLPAARDDEKPLAAAAARVRYLDRLPPADGEMSPEQGGSAVRVHLALFQWYADTRQTDLARDALRRAAGYAKTLAQTPDGVLALRAIYPGPVKEGEPAEAAFLRGLEATEEAFTRRNVLPATEGFPQQAGPADRFFYAAGPQPQFWREPQFARQLPPGYGVLPKKAIEVYKETPPKDFGPHAPIVTARAVELMEWAGRQDDALALFADPWVREVAARPPTSAEDQIARQRLLDAQIRVLVAEGDYPVAAEALKQVVGAQLPKLPPAALALARDPGAPPAAHMAPAGGAGGVVADAGRRADRNAALTHLLRESEYHFDLGVFALFQGDIPEARARFAQCPAPQGVDLDRLGVRSKADVARMYLELIDAARAR